MKKYNVGIVGATGVVGKKMIDVLAEYEFPINELRLFASKNSIGKTFSFNGKNCIVEKLCDGCFEGIHILMFSAGATISNKYARIASERGIYVIDNSSAFREKKDVPLVVPEVNFSSIKKSDLIISNPNCSTIQSIIPISIIDNLFKIQDIHYNTYQAVSGAGSKGIIALEDNYLLDGKSIVNNCIPKIGDITRTGYTTEELKMINETKRILNNDLINVTATCVRVPILNSHGVSVTVKCKNDICIGLLNKYLYDCNSIKICDGYYEDTLPSHIASTGTDIISVGRIRKDLMDKNTIHFYCTADNIRKGAATNSVQIALKLIEMGMI